MSNKVVVEQKYFTIPQVANMFGVAQRTVWFWLKKGHLKTFRLAGRLYVSKEELERNVQESTKYTKHVKN